MSTTPGLGTRALKLTIDSVDYTAAVSNVAIGAGDTDSDFLSFAQAAEGGSKDYVLALTTVQDPGASASLWRLSWDHSGDTVPVVIRPNGGTGTGTPDHPVVTFEAIVPAPDGDSILGGEANTSTSARFTTDLSFEIVGKPVIVTA